MKRHLCSVALAALVSVAVADTTMTYSGHLPGTTDDAVLFEDAHLLALTGISLDIRNYFGGILRNLTLSNIVADDAGVDGIYHYSNNGSTLEAHFEWKNYGYNFGLLLVLTQSGDDIRGRVVKVCYPGGTYGTDLNNQGSGSCRYFTSEADQDAYKSSDTFSTSCKNLALTFAATQSHTVTFVDWDGTVLDTQTVAYWHDATAPANPSRAGYVFVGWDKAFTQVTENLTVTALYRKLLTVTFLDADGTTLATQMVDHGCDATAPANPSRAGYVFIGWDKAFTQVTGDLTVTALYHALFTVTFLDADGTTLATQTVEEGTSATAPDMAGHTYNGNPFSGWDADFSSVTGNLTVTAQYAAPPAHVPAAIAAGDLPANALIWCGDERQSWDASSYNWYTTAGLTTAWTPGAVAVFATSGVVRVVGPKAAGGFIVALGANVALTGDAVSLASGAEAIFNSDGSLVLSNDVVCADGFVQRVRDAHDVFVPGTIHPAEIEGNLTATAEDPILLFSNVSLANVEYIEGIMTGAYGNFSNTKSLSSAQPALSDGGVYHFSNDGVTLTAQFQIKSTTYSGGCYNCIKISLEQRGTDIYGGIAYKKSGTIQYHNGPGLGLGTDWDEYTRGDNYSETICNLKVGIPNKTIYDVLPTAVSVEVAGDLDFTGTLNVSNGLFSVTDDGTLSGGNSTGSIATWNDGTILFGSSAPQTLVSDVRAMGTGEIKLLNGSTLSLKEPSTDRSWRLVIAGDASATGYKTLPANSGSTTVLPGGSLALDSFNSYWGPMAGAPLIVQTNGLLRLINENSIGVSKPIHLEGGTLSNTVDKANILYKIYMNDGAKVSGTGFRVGFKDHYNSWSFIDVGGSLPSLIDADSLMVGFQYPAGASAPIGVKFIVADVTGDDATDLLVTSPITERTGVTLFNEGYRDNLGVWKQGAGTLELASADNACTSGVFKVEAGTVRLGEGCGGNFGALIVLGDAAIDCAGGTIAFDDSAEFAWTEGATLRITGDCGPKTIRVGTDGSSLTAEQLASIAYVNAAGKLKTMTLSSDGYLRPPPKGTKFFVR